MPSCQADSGSCEVTIVDRVHTALRGFRADVAVEGLEAEVVEDEEIGAAQGFEEARMSPVASGEHEVAAKLRPAMIEDGAIVCGRLCGRWRKRASFCRRPPGPRGRDCRGRRSIRPPRASGTGRGPALG